MGKITKNSLKIKIIYNITVYPEIYWEWCGTLILIYNIRFLDYLTIMFTEFHTNKKVKSSDTFSKAYEIGLAPHHPFAIRTGAKICMLSAPSI